MAYRRGEKRDIRSIINEIFDRIEKLEETASRQSLPKGYRFVVADGTLKIRRDSDGAEQDIFNA